MDITPTPEFLAACEKVLGPGRTGPQHVIPAMRDDALNFRIREAHAAILKARDAEKACAA